MARELLLQPLVGVVDAQLLKAVARELLKAVDVQDGDGQPAALLACMIESAITRISARRLTQQLAEPYQ